jgi:hypothetical protein
MTINLLTAELLASKKRPCFKLFAIRKRSTFFRRKFNVYISYPCLRFTSCLSQNSGILGYIYAVFPTKACGIVDGECHAVISEQPEGEWSASRPDHLYTRYLLNKSLIEPQDLSG